MKVDLVDVALLQSKAAMMEVVLRGGVGVNGGSNNVEVRGNGDGGKVIN